MEDQGLYTVVVAMIGTATVTVQAASEAEACAIAENCTTPIMANPTWTYVAEEIVDIEPLQLALDIDEEIEA